MLSLDKGSIMVVQTSINYSDFLIMSRLPLEFAEIAQVLYVTDGVRTWEMREIQSASEPGKGD